MAGLSQALLGSGDLDGARSAADSTVSIAEETPELFKPQVLARIGRARALLQTNDFESGVERLLDEAAELIERAGAHLMAPSIAIERAELAHRRGQPDTRESQLEQARELFRSMGAAARADRLGK